MTAYRNDFLVVEETGSGSGGGSEGAEEFTGYFEPMAIDHEILTDADGDVVMGRVVYAT